MLGILVGRGRSPLQALAEVEALEDRGYVPGTETEPAWWHREERRMLRRTGYPMSGAVGRPGWDTAAAGWDPGYDGYGKAALDPAWE